MGIYIASAAAILCCVLTIIFCRRYVRSAFDSIDTVLDRVLSKDKALAFV